MARQGRRGNQEGSVTPRKDGYFSASIMIDGKRREFTTKTRKEGWARIDEARRQAEAGRQHMSDRQTVGQFLLFWLEDVVKPNVRKTSYDAYEQRVRAYLIPELGSIQLSKLTPQHIVRMQNNLLRQGRSPQTVDYCRRVLKTALEQAVTWELVRRNVVKQVDPPRIAEKERPFPNVDDARRILEAVRSTDDEVLFTTAILLGLRSAELRGLRWSDLDLDMAVLRVRFQLRRGVVTDPVWDEPKTDASKRSLPLTPSIVQMFRDHRKQQIETRLAHADVWRDTNLVFCDEMGQPIPTGTFLRHLRYICRDLGLPAYRVHDLRHACATFMAQQRVPLRTAMEVLGHSDPHTTQMVYQHAMPEDKYDAMTRIDDFVRRKKG